MRRGNSSSVWGDSAATSSTVPGPIKTRPEPRPAIVRSMRAIGVIPARFAASRFPGKPLAMIAGVPMVQRVWQGAQQAKHLSRVLIATEDERIASACRAFGAEVAMTSPDHPTGTDRIAEVAGGLREEIIVNIQGDEPLIEGSVIDAAVDALIAHPDVPMSTVVHPADADALDDPTA